MNLSTLDFVLFNVVSYIFGIATGLVLCCKNKELRRSPSLPDFRNFVAPVPVNHAEPNYMSPVLASAPPPSVPSLKLTVE
jgi:hypothetical protein